MDQPGYSSPGLRQPDPSHQRVELPLIGADLMSPSLLPPSSPELAAQAACGTTLYQVNKEGWLIRNADGPSQVSERGMECNAMQ